MELGLECFVPPYSQCSVLFQKKMAFIQRFDYSAASFSLLLSFALHFSQYFAFFEGGRRLQILYSSVVRNSVKLHMVNDNVIIAHWNLN